MTAQGTTRRPSSPSTSPDADSSSLLSSLRKTLSKFHEAVGGGGGIGIGEDDGDGDGTTGAAAGDAREEESKDEQGDDSEERLVFRPHDPSVGFRERLTTFRPEVYFAKPDEISPLVCARFGWECTEARDVLTCTHPGCNGAVCVWLGEGGEDRNFSGGGGGGEAPTTTDDDDDDEEDAAIARAAGPDVVRTLCSAYRKMLATAHDARTCPWRTDAERWLILDDDDECESDGASAGGGEGDDRSVDGRSSDVDVVVVPPFLLSVLPQLVIFEGPCVVDIGDDEDGGVRGRLVRSEARTRALELDRVLDDASAASAESSDASVAKNRRRRLFYDVAVPEELSSFLREGMLALRRRRRGRARADGDDEGDPESGNGEQGDNCQDPAGYIGHVLNSNVDRDGVGDDDDGPGAPMTTSGTADVTGGSSLLGALGWSPCLPSPLMTEDGSHRCVRMECRICLATGVVGLTEAYDQNEDGGDDDDKVRDTASSGGKKRPRPSPAGGGLVDHGDADGGLERSDDSPEIAEEAQVKKMRTGDDSSSSSSPAVLKRPSPGELTNLGEGVLANDVAQLKAGAECGARLDPVNSHRHFCPYVGGSLSLSTRRRRLRVGGSRHVIDRSATRNGGPHPVEESGPSPPPMTMIRGWQIVLGVLLRGAGTDEDDKEDDGDGGPSSSPLRTGHPKTESWREALLAVNRALEPAGSS